MAIHDAREIANFFLDLAEDLGLKITPMALQKVIYFAHGWHLLKFKTPLISNPIEAWEHGPVVRVLWREFQQFGCTAIHGRAKIHDDTTGEMGVASAKISEHQHAFLRNVLSYYGKIDAHTLSQMTHEQGGPWSIIWNANSGSGTGAMRITDDLIADYFANMARNKRLC